jgi:hypothetical protein
LVLALLSGESNLAPSGVSRYRKTARPCRFAAAMSVASRRSALTAASSTAARVTLLRMPSPERVSSTCGSSKGGAGKLSSADAFSSAANSGTRGSYKTFGGARRPDAVATKGAFAMRAGISPSWCVSEPSVRSASSIAASSARGGNASSRASTRVSRNDAGETRLTPRHVSNTCASSGVGDAQETRSQKRWIGVERPERGQTRRDVAVQRSQDERRTFANARTRERFRASRVGLVVALWKRRFRVRLVHAQALDDGQSFGRARVAVRPEPRARAEPPALQQVRAQRFRGAFRKLESDVLTSVRHGPRRERRGERVRHPRAGRRVYERVGREKTPPPRASRHTPRRSRLVQTSHRLLRPLRPLGRPPRRNPRAASP